MAYAVQYTNEWFSPHLKPYVLYLKLLLFILALTVESTQNDGHSILFHLFIVHQIQAQLLRFLRQRLSYHFRWTYAQPSYAQPVSSRPFELESQKAKNCFICHHFLLHHRTRAGPRAEFDDG